MTKSTRPLPTKAMIQSRIERLVDDGKEDMRKMAQLHYLVSKFSATSRAHCNDGRPLDLMTLPAKVRKMIYVHAVDGARITYHSEGSDSQVQKSDHFAVLFVCRQTTEEARTILYGTMDVQVCGFGQIFLKLDQYLPLVVRQHLTSLEFPKHYFQQMSRRLVWSLPHLERVKLGGTEQLVLTEEVQQEIGLNIAEEHVKDHIRKRIINNDAPGRDSIRWGISKGWEIEGRIVLQVPLPEGGHTVHEYNVEYSKLRLEILDVFDI